ncbi:MAG: toll/interleukin-1 receptor domain-containing protein [Pyrinomonadaceae bacterium]
MSDIFLNYAFNDVRTAEKLAALFEQQGLTVWWFMHVKPPGEDLASFVAKELESAKVIVTLWSFKANDSFIVRENLKHKRLALPVFVLLDKAAPLPELAPSFDLSDWNGVAAHTGLQKLLRHLRALIAASSPTTEQREARDAPPLVSSPIHLRKSGDPITPSQAPQNSATVGVDSRQEGQARFNGVFISYRRNEAAAYARGLYDRLAKHFGREKVFLDLENVGWGEDFVEAITSAAESCAVLIALISREWSRSAGGKAELDDYVRLEVAKALERKIRVIPILIQGASMPAPKELPEDLAPLVRRNALALSDTRWERDVEDLMKSLEYLLNN